MKALIKRFLKEEHGVTAIEYGLIAGLIAIAIVLALGTLSTNLSTTFTNIGTCLTTGGKTCFPS